MGRVHPWLWSRAAPHPHPRLCRSMARHAQGTPQVTCHLGGAGRKVASPRNRLRVPARLSPSLRLDREALREEREAEDCAPSGLARRVGAEVAKWIRVNRRPGKRKRGKREAAFEKLSPDQIILLLECLLEQKTLSPQTLQRLQQTYGLQEQDAEVRHRWCELVVKHKYAKAYEQVERFLQEDQAMGVYLYGELMLSEDARQQQLARRCFERVREHMDRASAQVVSEMLF